MIVAEIGMQESFSSAGHLGERLHAFIDDELSPQDQALARDHLADCESCAEEHRRLARASTSLGALGHVRAPEGFTTRVVKRLRLQRRQAGQRILSDQKVPFEGGIIIILAAAAALALMLYATRTSHLVAQNEAPPPTVGR